MRILAFVIGVVFLFGADTLAQKNETVKPPAEDATAEEVQKWLVGSLAKYGSYKTRVGSAEISNVRFEGCAINYVQARKSGTMSNATMGATRTVNTVKEDLAVNLALLAPDAVTLGDHIYPELQTLELKQSSGQSSGLNDDRVVSLVVKREAGDAIKATLIRAARACSPKS
jgi:hypothetical protein